MSSSVLVVLVAVALSSSAVRPVRGVSYEYAAINTSIFSLSHVASDGPQTSSGGRHCFSIATNASACDSSSKCCDPAAQLQQLALSVSSSCTWDAPSRKALVKQFRWTYGGAALKPTVDKRTSAVRFKMMKQATSGELCISIPTGLLDCESLWKLCGRDCTWEIRTKKKKGRKTCVLSAKTAINFDDVIVAAPYGLQTYEGQGNATFADDVKIVGSKIKPLDCGVDFLILSTKDAESIINGSLLVGTLGLPTPTSPPSICTALLRRVVGLSADAATGGVRLATEMAPLIEVYKEASFSLQNLFDFRNGPMYVDLGPPANATSLGSPRIGGMTVTLPKLATKWGPFSLSMQLKAEPVFELADLKLGANFEWKSGMIKVATVSASTNIIAGLDFTVTSNIQGNFALEMPVQSPNFLVVPFTIGVVPLFYKASLSLKPELSASISGSGTTTYRFTVPLQASITGGYDPVRGSTTAVNVWVDGPNMGEPSARMGGGAASACTLSVTPAISAAITHTLSVTADLPFVPFKLGSIGDVLALDAPSFKLVFESKAQVGGATEEAVKCDSCNTLAPAVSVNIGKMPLSGEIKVKAAGCVKKALAAANIKAEAGVSIQLADLTSGLAYCPTMPPALLTTGIINTCCSNIPCKVSDWGAWSSCAGAATATRSRVVTRPPVNGGTACPTLTETCNCEPGSPCYNPCVDSTDYLEGRLKLVAPLPGKNCDDACGRVDASVPGRVCWRAINGGRAGGQMCANTLSPSGTMAVGNMAGSNCQLSTYAGGSASSGSHLCFCTPCTGADCDKRFWIANTATCATAAPPPEVTSPNIWPPCRVASVGSMYGTPGYVQGAACRTPEGSSTSYDVFCRPVCGTSAECGGSANVKWVVPTEQQCRALQDAGITNDYLDCLKHACSALGAGWHPAWADPDKSFPSQVVCELLADGKWWPGRTWDFAGVEPMPYCHVFTDEDTAGVYDHWHAEYAPDSQVVFACSNCATPAACAGDWVSLASVTADCASAVPRPAAGAVLAGRHCRAHIYTLWDVGAEHGDGVCVSGAGMPDNLSRDVAIWCPK